MPLTRKRKGLECADIDLLSLSNTFTFNVLIQLRVHNLRFF